MKTKRNGIIAAVLILCGALGLTTGCKSGNTNIQQVKGTLEAKVVDDSVPAKVREAMDLAYEGRYEKILDDTASHVSVWSLLRCNPEVSSEGFGIHVVKDKQVTKMPEMRHGNNPKARYDSQSGNLWMACAAMEGTGVLVERLHLLRFHDDGTAYSVATIDPYEMQQALCQRLGFTVDSMNVTFYDRQQALGTVTNTITDMGGFDADDPVWIGEQMTYDISGDSIRVKIVPGIKFTTGLVLHYEEMPTLSHSPLATSHSHQKRRWTLISRPLSVTLPTTRASNTARGRCASRTILWLALTRAMPMTSRCGATSGWTTTTSQATRCCPFLAAVILV